MFQETLFRANTSSHIVLRAGIVATLIFASQGFGATSRAEANTLANVYEAVSVSVAYGVGDRVCGIPCGAVAAAATQGCCACLPACPVRAAVLPVCLQVACFDSRVLHCGCA